MSINIAIEKVENAGKSKNVPTWWCGGVASGQTEGQMREGEAIKSQLR